MLLIVRKEEVAFWLLDVIVGNLLPGKLVAAQMTYIMHIAVFIVECNIFILAHNIYGLIRCTKSCQIVISEGSHWTVIR